MKKNGTKLNSLDKYKFANKVCKYNMDPPRNLMNIPHQFNAIATKRIY